MKPTDVENSTAHTIADPEAESAESILVRNASRGETPRVSVNMITYNHENFVGDAIAGIWGARLQGTDRDPRW